MRFTHQQLSAMSQPASDTEEEKLDRARKLVSSFVVSSCPRS